MFTRINHVKNSIESMFSMIFCMIDLAYSYTMCKPHFTFSVEMCKVHLAHSVVICQAHFAHSVKLEYKIMIFYRIFWLDLIEQALLFILSGLIQHTNQQKLSKLLRYMVLILALSAMQKVGRRFDKKIQDLCGSTLC